MAASNPQVGARGEVNLLGVGTNVLSLDKSTGNSWALNVLYRNGHYEVRSGLGTLGRFSTTLNAGRVNGDTYGYTKHVGSYYYVSDAGHEQLLSVLNVTSYSTDSRLDSTNAWVDPLCQLANTVALSVFDITTRRRTELLFLVKTAELVPDSSEDITKIYPHGQTNSQQDRQRLLQATASSCSFNQLADVVYITLPGIGTYSYRPVDPIGVYGNTNDRKAKSINRSLWQVGGEQTALGRLVPADGPFNESYAYFRPSEWVPPTCATVITNRMVYAAGRTLYFSDPDLPNHIITDNTYVVGCDNPITALRALSDRLYVFTTTQIFLYQLSYQDTLASGGRLIELSRGQGATSQNHTCVAGDYIAFVDSAGVSVISGATITSLSDEIAPWFTDLQGIQNPLSSYKVASGVTSLTGEQPRARISLQDQLVSSNMTWHDQTGTLYITFEDTTLVWRKDGGWAVWMYETTAVASVSITRNILKPWLLAGGSKLYAVSGPHETAYTNVTDSNYMILEYGRGGALDVSSAEQEDYRSPSAGWKKQAALSGVGAVYFGQIQKMPAGFRTLNNVMADGYLVPVYIQSGLVDLTAGFAIRATYDYVNWQFLTTGPDGEVDFLVPPERTASESEYQRGAMDNLHQVRLWNTISVLPSNTGNQLRIDFDGTLGAWNFAPELNIPINRPTCVLYLPVYRLTNTTSMDLTINVSLATTHNAALVTTNAKAYVWQESKSYPAQSLASDALAQPVDWAIKSAAVSSEGNQVKMRGIYSKIMSYGTATLRNPNWRYGPLNTTTAADYKDFSGQILDWADTVPGIDEITNKASIRMRIQQLATPVSALGYKTGNNIAKWGTTADSSKGNMLIDDAAVNTIATSESIRGESFSTMLYGTMADPGEHLEIQEVKGEYVVVGGKRRIGRS